MGSAHKKHGTLSLCMIVKNEERFLPECLESVADVVDQIVIVDTGSGDGTIEVAKRREAEVHLFKWADDFSKARNYSIKFARCDWILWLDADERLLPESVPEVQKLLRHETRPIIYRVYIRNLLADGSNYSLSSAHRLFNNHRGIHFSGRIHEQVSPSAAALNGRELESSILIHHLGYGLQKQEAKAKNRRNRKLLEKMVRDMPRSAYAHYTLAQHYGLTGNPERALHHYKVSYGLRQFDSAMTASLLNSMAESLVKLGQFEEAERFCTQSIRMIPLQAAGYYMLYKIALGQGKANAALKWLQELYKNTHHLQNRPKQISTDILLEPDKIVYTMGELYRKEGRLVEAMECFEKVLINQPDHKMVLAQLAQVYVDLGNLQGAEKCLIRLTNVVGEKIEYLELLGRVLIKQAKFAEAINVYESLVLKQPEERSFVKHLIGLYGKVGEMQKAEELMAVSCISMSATG